MKKILSVILICVMTVSLFALAVSAQVSDDGEIKSLVVLGDSISTGYGLEGSIYTRASYANLVAQALGLRQGEGYVNYAVDGHTSERILKDAIKQENSLKEADLILLTCGGNDILQHALSIAGSASGITSGDLMQIVFAILQMPTEQLNAALHSEENEKIISDALATYRENMESLVKYLKETAPEARVVFLTQYNPASGIPIATALDLYAEEIIGRLNDVMKEIVEAGGCEIVDTHAVMIQRGMELSNIMSSDIHPNASGHAEMAAMVKAHLGIVDPETESTTAAPEVTTVEPAMTTTLPETTTAEPVMTTTLPAATTTTVTTTVTTTEATTVATTTETVAVTTTVTNEPPVSESTSTSAETPTMTATEENIPVGEPTEDEPTENKSSTWMIVIGATLLLVGTAGVVIAVAIRKKM